MAFFVGFGTHFLTSKVIGGYYLKFISRRCGRDYLYLDSWTHSDILPPLKEVRASCAMILANQA